VAWVQDAQKQVVPDVTVWMPCAPGEQPRPAPPLLTADEVCQLLRLDVSGCRNPRRTLEYYRQQGLLSGIKSGRTVMYPLASVYTFIQHKLRDQPR
jgi:hypothetical protein